MILRKIVNNVRLVRSKFTAKKGELSLPALLNPSSPYHKDFIPIYNVITDLNVNWKRVTLSLVVQNYSPVNIGSQEIVIILELAEMMSEV